MLVESTIYTVSVSKAIKTTVRPFQHQRTLLLSIQYQSQRLSRQTVIRLSYKVFKNLSIQYQSQRLSRLINSVLIMLTFSTIYTVSVSKAIKTASHCSYILLFGFYLYSISLKGYQDTAQAREKDTAAIPIYTVSVSKAIKTFNHQSSLYSCYLSIQYQSQRLSRRSLFKIVIKNFTLSIQYQSQRLSRLRRSIAFV